MHRPSGIHGVRIHDLSTIVDERGGFTELFRQDWIEDRPGMVQCNLSRSRAGVLRGMHFHRRQADHSCVIEGSALVALVDLRSGSPSALRTETIDLDAGAAMAGIYVPPGVAHGFYARTDMTLLYLVDAPFDGDDEFGFAWDDPEAAIPWPAASPVLSERDAGAPSLAEALENPPKWG